MTDSTRTEWELARRGGIGASDVAKTRLRQYGGGVGVVAEKLGIDPDPDSDRQARFDRGHRWEHPLADSVAALLGYVVAGEQLRLTHRTNPRFYCHPDGLLIPAGHPLELDHVEAGLEIKTRDPHAASRWDYYTDQAQAGMAVSGLPRWLVAVGTIDIDYNYRTGNITEMPTNVTYRWVERDEARIAELEAIAVELWEWVERGELPPADDAEALPYVKAANTKAGVVCEDCGGSGRLYDAAKDKTRPCKRCDSKGRRNVDAPPELGDDLSALIARRELVRAKVKEAEAEADTIEAQLRQAIGDATEVVTADGAWRVRCGLPVRKFTSRSEADFLELYGAKAAELGLLRTVLDREATKAAMPDEYDALRIATPQRALTVKNLNPEDNL